MKTQTKLFLFLIFIFVFAITACNLPFGNQGKAEEETGQTTDEESGNTIEEQTAEPLLEIFKEPDPDPVGLQDGLGSLDSYKIQINVKMSDEKGSKYRVNEFAERSVVDKNSHSKTTIVTFDPAEDTEENKQTMESYSVGLVTCTKSDEVWEYKEMTAQEKEMRDIFSSMLDFIPLIDDPKFVAEEELNGIKTNHFSFMVNGIGDTSGSVATINQGDYWLAQDGNFFVRYQLVLEIRSAAEGTEGAQVSNMEVYMDLTEVNVPVSVSLPSDCQPGSESE